MAGLVLIGIGSGLFVWWKFPQWIDLKNDVADTDGFEPILNHLNLFYDLKYQQNKWLEEEKYGKLGRHLLKDNKSRKFIMTTVPAIIFLIGLVIVYDIYVIDGDLPILILAGINAILLGPVVFAFDRSMAKEIKKIGHL